MKENACLINGTFNFLCIYDFVSTSGITNPTKNTNNQLLKRGCEKDINVRGSHHFGIFSMSLIFKTALTVELRLQLTIY